MEFNPHVSFNGQCEAAFKFYEDCLGGKITFLLKYGDSPMAEQFLAVMKDKVLHGTFTLNDRDLTGTDVPSEQYEKPRGFSMQLNLVDVAEAERIFKALAENGTVTMPFAETFWALRYGLLTDQFGVPWEINCGKE